MFTVLTHQIGTPLHALLGFLDFIKDEGIHADNLSEIQVYFKYISEAAHKMNDSFSSIVASFRDLWGELKLEQKIHDIDALTRPLVASFEDKCAEKECRISVSVTGLKGTKLICDLTLMKQALGHVMDNAIRYSPPSDQVTFDLSRGNAGGIVFAITDNGCGMTPEQLKTCTTPLAHISTSMNEKDKGLGVGLALAKRLVEAHGGQLMVSSQPGSGTNVTVFLPESCVKSG